MLHFHRKAGAVAVLALFCLSCASLGGSDPVVVRAEDVLTNSITLYSVAMQWHYANSRSEDPKVYQTLEIIRKEFPKAWRSLDSAVPAYKASKDAMERKKLQDALRAVEVLVANLRTIWGGTL